MSQNIGKTKEQRSSQPITVGQGTCDLIESDIHDGEMGVHNVAAGFGGKSNYTIDKNAMPSEIACSEVPEEQWQSKQKERPKEFSNQPKWQQSTQQSTASFD